MATPYEWRIDAIEQKAQRACDSLWKLDSLGSDVARVEHSVRELCTCVDGLRSALDSSLTRIEQLERTVEEISSANIPGQPRPDERKGETTE